MTIRSTFRVAVTVLAVAAAVGAGPLPASGPHHLSSPGGSPWIDPYEDDPPPRPPVGDPPPRPVSPGCPNCFI